MREHMSSSPLNSPPHHDMPFIDADRAPSGRIRHMGGRRHCHARVDEEVLPRNYAGSVLFSSLCLVLGYDFFFRINSANYKFTVSCCGQRLKTLLLGHCLQ